MSKVDVDSTEHSLVDGQPDTSTLLDLKRVRWSALIIGRITDKDIYAGWAPSTFKSSRSSRASKVQRAEDFMDEEDLQQMRDDRQLENTDIFRNEAFAGTREPLADKK